MPVNIGITFIVGSTFGWIAVKILKPEPYIQDLIIAMCSAGKSIHTHVFLYMVMSKLFIYINITD